MKTKSRFILLIVALLFSAAEIFARAGGGGGSSGGGYSYHPSYHSYSSGSSGDGGGGDGLMIVPLLLSFIGGVVVVILVAAIWRMLTTRRRLAKAQTTDPLWNVKVMKQHALDVFHRMQDAWSRQYMDPVEDIVLPELMSRYASMLSNQRRQNMRNVIGQITITKARIVHAEDSADNSNDRFSIYIAGTMIDYMESWNSSSDKTNYGATIPQPFDDTYHFRRVGNVWMLENINNAPGRIEKMTASLTEEM
jgi:hypothetical protein